MIEGICEMTLEAHDLDRLVAFYRRAFALDVLATEDDRVWLSCGNRARLGIWTPGRKEFGDRGGRHVHFALSVSAGHLGQLRDRWTSLGLAFRGPIEHPGGDRSLYIEDVEGNIVEVWDFFTSGEGAVEGVEALNQDPPGQVSHSK